ncbi:hypothetical protein EPO04_03490 [Patescibacteria group bacterium]|nr:MAG: hypothetical protein EPO04_03490 [Patescibacteria group bacterium]
MPLFPGVAVVSTEDDQPLVERSGMLEVFEQISNHWLTLEDEQPPRPRLDFLVLDRDLESTLGQNWERFSEQLRQAMENGVKIFVVVVASDFDLPRAVTTSLKVWQPIILVAPAAPFADPLGMFAAEIPTLIGPGGPVDMCRVVAAAYRIATLRDRDAELAIARYWSTNPLP